jgi:hypothetical protein
MLTKLAAGLAVVAVLGACERPANRETGTADQDRTGMDTMVESSRIKDTTVVKADTNIDVDTVKKTDNIKNR